MKYYQGDSFLNSAINKLPFEMHIPGYNWCGPGTKVEKRLARNDPGINGLDEACKEHDIVYNNESDLSRRHEADRVLQRKALARVRAKDASWKEKLAALGVAGAMKAKVKLGMGLKQRQRTITDCKKKLQKVKKELSTSLKHVEEVFNILVENNGKKTVNSSSSSSSSSSRKTGKKRQTIKKKKIDAHSINKVKNKTKPKRQTVEKNKKIDKMNVDIINKVQRKRKNIKNKKNNDKKQQGGVEPLQSAPLPMDVDITYDDNNDMMNRMKRKRKIDSNDLDQQPLCKRKPLTAKRKESLVKMNEPIRYPAISRKRKRSTGDDDDDDEGMIPQKVQVINKE